MDIAHFGVEEWLNTWEKEAKFDLSQSTVSSLTLEEIIGLDNTIVTEFFNGLATTKLNYGWIEGSPEFKREVAKLYKHVEVDNILQTHGATGGNLLAMYALIKPGDHVISLFPTYQQLYDIPKSFGAIVDFVYLDDATGWQVSIDELIAKIRPNTKMICLNSANNPTGTLIKRSELEKIVTAAEKVGAYILMDEVYMPFSAQDEYVSVVDIYERGITVNSLSKAFSVPGIRIGWTATNKALADVFRKYRDYTMICSGILDDAIAVHVLKNKEKLLKRNQEIVIENLAIVTDWVEKEPRVSLVTPEEVSTSFIKLNIPMTTEEFCIRLLKEEGVLLVPGSAYQLEGYARLGYCCNKATLVEGLNRLSRFLTTIDEKEDKGGK